MIAIDSIMRLIGGLLHATGGLQTQTQIRAAASVIGTTIHMDVTGYITHTPTGGTDTQVNCPTC